MIHQNPDGDRISYIQILFHIRTQAFAIRFANRIDGYFEQRVFPDERFQIDLGIFGNDQLGIAYRFSVNALQLGHIPLHRVIERFQATYTIERGITL